MRRVLLFALLVFCVVVCTSFSWLAPIEVHAQQPAKNNEVDSAKIRGAIDKGIEYLLNQQNQNGSWGDYSIYPHGKTALCILTLLNCGLPPEHEAIQKGVAWITRDTARQVDKVYCSSLIIMALAACDPQKYKAK